MQQRGLFELTAGNIINARPGQRPGTRWKPELAVLFILTVGREAILGIRGSKEVQGFSTRSWSSCRAETKKDFPSLRCLASH